MQILWPLIGALVLGSGAPASTSSSNAPNDAVDSTWSARGDLARKRIAAGGLDACDTAVEEAFRDAKATVESGVRDYGLDVHIGEERLVVLYRYKASRLEAFAMLHVPAEWAVYQPAGSKTLRFIVDAQKCAFSLCTNGPTSDGPCDKKKGP